MRGPRLAWAAVAVCAVLCVAAPAASAQAPSVPKLDFKPCGGRVATVQCMTAKVPLDYDRPDGRNISLFLAKSPATDQAHKLGTLFFNFGGPGGTAADFLEFFGPDLFPAFNERYDIIGMDPRGVGQSEPAIDCKANQETQGIYSQPFPTPDNVKPQAYPSMLVHVSLNDSQVPYWEGAKLVAKLRTMKTDTNQLLLKTNFGAGHGGASGRYDALRELAFTYAYMLGQMGLLPGV